MTKYFSRERRLERQSSGIREILAAAQKKRPNGTSKDFEKKSGIFLCSPSDAREMSAVYQQVFRTYPFPIYDPDYLIDSMKQHIHYYCVREGNRIVSLASSEIDADSLSAEMMDFATLPDWRGQRLARQLLERMETEMTRLNMRTAYTIARALSPAMNITFARMGYAYGGTLNNNTNISGHIQSMNVWYKSLQKTIPRA